jgi:hypothetical protein
MHEEHQVPIWFFIGGLLLIYGILILGMGLFHLVAPPPSSEQVTLYNLHADIWWGVLMIAAGLFYTIRFHPSKIQTNEPPDRHILDLERAPEGHRA